MIRSCVDGVDVRELDGAEKVGVVFDGDEFVTSGDEFGTYGGLGACLLLPVACIVCFFCLPRA